MASSNVLKHNNVMGSYILEELYDSFNENEREKVKHVIVLNEDLCLSNKSGNNKHTNITFFKLLNRMESQENVDEKKPNRYIITCAEDVTLPYMFTLAGLGRIKKKKQICYFKVNNNPITIETVMFLRKIGEDSFKKLLYRSILAKKKLHENSILNNIMFGEDAYLTIDKACRLSRITPELFGGVAGEGACSDDVPESGVCETLYDRKMVAANQCSDELDEDDKWYVVENFNAALMQIDHTDLSFSRFISNFKTKALFKYIKKGNIVGVNFMIKIGVDVNHKSKLGEIALNKAIFFGSREIVMMLLEAGAHVNSKDENDCSPMQIAFAELERGFFVDYNDFVRFLYLVSDSVYSRNEVSRLVVDNPKAYKKDIVCILVYYHAKVDCTIGRFGWTPLHDAVFFNDIELVKAIISSDVSIIDFKEQEFFNASLHYAVRLSGNDIVKFLLESKADVNCIDEKEMTPLHHAAFVGNYEVVKILLEAKANVNSVDKNGKTPMHYAVESESKRNKKNPIKFRDVSELYENILKIADILITTKGYVSCKDEFGRVPLHCAVIDGEDNVAYCHVLLRLLIKNCVNINCIDIYEKTALNYTMDDSNEVAKCSLNSILVYEAGANLSYLSQMERSSIFMNLIKEDTNTSDIRVTNAKQLINAGIEINYKNNKMEMNPLILACLLDRIDIVKILVDAGVGTYRAYELERYYVAEMLLKEQLCIQFPSLQDICRHNIRLEIMAIPSENSFSCNVDKLGVPAPICRYLCGDKLDK